MKLDLENTPESEAIVKYITGRIKKGLGCNILVVAPPGLGKSWSCIRLMELIMKSLYGEKIPPEKILSYIVDFPPDIFRFVRNVKRPEPLTIEEISVLYSSRRSMSLDNVEFNGLIDTARSKQIILLMNSQHINFIDKHILMLSHLLIECLKINLTEEVCILKPLILQTNQRSGKTYYHRLWADGSSIHRSYLRKPSSELIKMYEKKKAKFQDTLYHLSELKARKRKQKETTALLKGSGRAGKKPPTPFQEQMLSLHDKGITKTGQMAEKLKVTPQKISLNKRWLRNKGFLLGNRGFDVN